jgi:hypothetical protein
VTTMKEKKLRHSVLRHISVSDEKLLPVLLAGVS